MCCAGCDSRALVHPGVTFGDNGTWWQDYEGLLSHQPPCPCKLNSTGGGGGGGLRVPPQITNKITPLAVQDLNGKYTRPELVL
jgi:hypothetical protein